MTAQPSVGGTDRLIRAHSRARWVFLSLVGVLGALVCMYVYAVAANDSLLPAPLNLILFLLLSMAALAVLGVRLVLDVRIDLARAPMVTAADLARLYGAVASVTGRHEQLRADFIDHVEDTRELAVVPRGRVTVVHTKPRRRSRNRRHEIPLPQDGSATVTELPTAAGIDPDAILRARRITNRLNRDA